METEDLITRDMFLMDIITKYPEAAPILMGYGLHCIGCHFSGADTLEMGARLHGMDDETIEMMLRDVNIIVKEFNKDIKKTNLLSKHHNF